MRHGDVAYFDADGRPVRPADVKLTPAGREQAQAAAALFEGVRLDRVVTSGLARTLETARLVVPRSEPESWPDLREIEPGRLSEIPADEVEEAFLGAFRGRLPEDHRFLGGETIGSLLDRALPALYRLLADPAWDVLLAVLHGAVNRAILSYALTGERALLGGFEQAPGCINVVDVGDDWIVRAVNVTPADLLHRSTRMTTMEELFAQYRP
jgi:probable phosphoglycerate mutase